MPKEFDLEVPYGEPSKKKHKASDAVGTLIVKARPTGVPGLVITRPLVTNECGVVEESTKGWKITHEVSGFGVASVVFSSIPKAITAAKAMADAVDWTLSGPEVQKRADKEIIRKALRTIYEVRLSS